MEGLTLVRFMALRETMSIKGGGAYHTINLLMHYIESLL